MIASILLKALLATQIASVPLQAAEIVNVPGPVGRYDYLINDNKMGRIIAAHSGAGGLTVLDLKTKTATSLPGPKCNGVVVDAKDNLYLTAGSGGKLVSYDRETLKQVGMVDLAGPGDAMTFNPKTGLVYVDEDDGTHVWAFDPKTLKLSATVAIKGAPEWIQYDAGSDKIYQNLKEPELLQVIDPAENKVVADWQLPGVQSPHGMALDGRAKKVFTAGKNGTLALVDMTTGKIESTATISKGVDQIAYDRRLHRIYCACSGQISVVDFKDGKLVTLGDVASPAGAHTLAIDAKSHDVWVATATKEQSFLQRFAFTGAVPTSKD